MDGTLIDVPESTVMREWSKGDWRLCGDNMLIDPALVRMREIDEQLEALL